MRPGLRLEVMAAYGVGIFLPVAEVVRRRDDFSDLPVYVDDFILGGLLLFAAWSVSKGRRTGPLWLIAAWSAFCGMMYYSFFGQLGSTSSHDISGFPNSFVVAVKGLLLLTGLIAVVASTRRARDTLPAGG